MLFTAWNSDLRCKNGGTDTEGGTYTDWGDAYLNLLDEKTKFALYSFKFRLETAEIWVALKIGNAHTHRQKLSIII